MSNLKIRVGVLGTAKIGREQVIPALAQSQYVEVTAIASRDLNVARRVAEALGIAKAYGSYEELLSDAAIDAIYNPLPNNLTTRPCLHLLTMPSAICGCSRRFG
jgi:predicted dehydrogenase